MSIPPPPDEKAAAWCTPLASWRDALNKTPTDKIIPTQTDCRHGFRLASTASLAAARRGPMKHRRSRPTDLSRGAVSSGAHGLQNWACRARSPRIVQLVSALLRRAARSSPVVNSRTERRPIEAARRRRRWALGPSGWIAAGVPGRPLSGALGVEQCCGSAPTLVVSHPITPPPTAPATSAVERNHARYTAQAHSNQIVSEGRPCCLAAAARTTALPHASSHLPARSMPPPWHAQLLLNALL